MSNRNILIIGCFWTALFGVILTLAITHAEPPRPLPAVESPEPPLALPVLCSECNGAGKVDGKPCMLCPGTGKWTDSKGVEHVCVMCGGTGKRSGPCPICGGGGVLYTDGHKPTAAEQLAPDEERLFARLRPHMEALVEQRLVSAVNEAASDKKTGVGTALAAALGRLVLKLVEGAVAAIIIAAVVALLWSHWYLVAAFFSAVAAVGWLGGKKAASK